MTTRLRVGVVVAQEFDLHLRDVASALAAEHHVTRFRRRRTTAPIAATRIDRARLDRDLARLVREHDVVFFEWAEDEFVRATHLPTRCPIVVRLHLHELWDFLPQADLAAVARLITVSQAMERKVLLRHPELTGRTIAIHNGVRLDRFRPGARDFGGVIGTLGRIEPHKRIYDLVLALHVLREQGHDVSLRIGGCCTEPRYERYADEVVLLARRLGLAPHVTFDGQVDDAPAWLRGIDIFVSHSCSEGLQVALLEAMATGCWCLSHRWDGAEEALPEEHLYLDEGDLVRHVAAICRTSPAERAARGARLRRRAEERFDIDRQKKLVVTAIESAAGLA